MNDRMKEELLRIEMVNCGGRSRGRDENREKYRDTKNTKNRHDINN